MNKLLCGTITLWGSTTFEKDNIELQEIKCHILDIGMMMNHGHGCCCHKKAKLYGSRSHSVKYIVGLLLVAVPAISLSDNETVRFSTPY